MSLMGFGVKLLDGKKATEEVTGSEADIEKSVGGRIMRILGCEYCEICSLG